MPGLFSSSLFPLQLPLFLAKNTHGIYLTLLIRVASARFLIGACMETLVVFRPIRKTEQSFTCSRFESGSLNSLKNKAKRDNACAVSSTVTQFNSQKSSHSAYASIVR